MNFDKGNMADLNKCIFRKSGRLSSTSNEMLAFVSHCSANFKPILDCSIPKFKYEDSENIIADRITTVVFNLRQIKRRAFFLGSYTFSYAFSQDFSKSKLRFSSTVICCKNTLGG